MAGGTGLVGRLVVDALSTQGHEPVVLARAAGVDLTNSRDLAERLRDVQAVVDVTNVETLNGRRATAFFTAVTENLLAAERAAGVGHHVLLSIVGVDRVPTGYYRAKVRQEELVTSSDLPHTILRTTQFHEFGRQLLDRVPGPLVLLPRMTVQPVAAAEVAARLAALASSAPAGRARELAGPEVHELAELVGRLLRATSSRRRVVPVRLPGSAGRAMASGGLLPSGEYDVGRVTFQQWLEEITGRPPLPGESAGA